MKASYRLAALAALIPALGLVSGAQAGMAHHGHGKAAARACHTVAASTQAYQQAMARMHEQMRQPRSGDPDIDFVRQMIPHHQAAVEMARIQLAHGKDEALKDFSRWIIQFQSQEIGMMKNWLRGHDNGVEKAGATDYYGPSMERMHHAMMITYTGDADADFVRGMIPHHQGAVDMAAIVTARGHNPEIRALAEGIQRSQNYEIGWQQAWLRDRTEPPHFPSFIY